MNTEKNNMVSYLVLMLVISIIWAGSVSAQEAVEANSESQNQAEKQQQPSKSKPKEKVFKPSEEISEDSPVPFPVDI